MARDNTGRDEKIKNLEGICKDLENKTCEIENTMFQNQTDLESFKMNIQMQLRGVGSLLERVRELEDHDENHEERIKTLEQEMNDAKNKLLLVGSGGSGEGIDGDALSKMMDNLRDEFGKRFVEKPDHESLKERVEQLEQTSEQHGIDIEELKSRKVDKDAFEAELANLKAILNSKAAGDVTLPSSNIDLSPSEMTLLKQIFATWPDVENLLANSKGIDLQAIVKHIKSLEELLDGKAD